MSDPTETVNSAADKTVSAANVLEAIVKCLPDLCEMHVTTSLTYEMLKTASRVAVEGLFSGEDIAKKPFRPFGDIVFPYYKMGAIDSLDLFGIDELIIFAFYRANKGKYSRIADMGANIGLHSLVLGKCGYEVRCYEPDPEIFGILSKTVDRNNLTTVTPINAAVSTHSGKDEFVRLMGNRTGSHLSGAKPNPYGELERFPVELNAFGPIAEWADLMKIDVEGHEKELILSSNRAMWETVDAIMEVGSEENAEAIYRHLTEIGVRMFSQKCGWKAVKSVEDMPTSYKDGGLFVSVKTEMPWG